MEKYNAYLEIVKNILKTIKNYTMKNINANPRGFDDLTPVNHADQDNEYSNAILWGLNNDAIKNIAITGPYGSGKSSILKTFEKNNKKFNFLNISLGTFKSEKNIPNLNKEELEKQTFLIEKSILQQILYKVKNQKIPYSRFKKIKNIKFHTHIIQSLAITLWAGLAYSLTKNSRLELRDTFELYSNNEKLILVISIAIFLTGLGLIINYLFGLLNQHKLNRVNITSGDFQFDEENGSSILNKHLDEILYFFEMTNFNVVVIEDLDRFEEIEIFIKLREINTLINSSDNILRKIVFIYAVRDNIFKEDDRTKFFDFIIPIIPIINSSNSSNILTKKLTENSYSIDKKFINDITLYVDDMRMLKNIYNEFVIYQNKLSAVSGISYKLDKLLSFIVYKNKYPADFAALNSNSGMVADFFKSKDSIIQRITSTLEADLHERNKALKDLSKEKLTTIDELRKVYIATIYSSIQNCGTIAIENQAVNFKELLSDEVFNKIITINNFYYYPTNTGYGRTQSGVSFKQIESSISTQSYAEREEAILRKINNETENEKKEIERIKNTISEINSYSIKTLMLKFQDISFYDENLKKCKLLTYLIRQGYIDEMYHTFTSYFYEGDLTKGDMDFILSVKNQEPKNYTHSLQMTDKVITKLSIEDFGTRATLNFDLFKTLLNTPANYRHLEIFIDQLQNNTSYSVDFIDIFLTTNTDISSKMISAICKKWHNFWNEIESHDFSMDKLNYYLILILKNLDLSTINKLNINNQLARHIENNVEPMALISLNIDLKKSKEITRILNLKYANIVAPQNKNEYFEYIYHNNYYDKNISTIGVIAQYFLQNEFDSNNYQTSHITTLNSSNLTHLIDYIENDIESYVSMISDTLQNNIHENENTILYILNNEELSSDTKINFAKVQIENVSNIKDITDHNLWDKIFDTSKVQSNWNNLIDYFNVKEEINDIIYSYLNKNYELISRNKAPNYSSKESPKTGKLYIHIIQSNQLSDDCYKSLVKSIPYWYPQLDALHKLSASKVKILLEEKKLQLTESNFTTVQDSFPDLCPILIEHNIDEFLTSLPKYALTSGTLGAILSSKNINLQQKISIINSVEPSIFSEANRISDFAISRSFNGTANPSINFETLKPLIDQSSNIEHKIKIFMGQALTLNKSQTIELLPSFGSPIAGILTNKQPKIVSTRINIEFCDKLKSFGIISSFSENNGVLKLVPKRQL